MPICVRALLLAAAAALALGAAPARAATISVDDGVLRYVAEAGESNEVFMLSDPDVEGLVYVYEFFAPVTPGAGCVPTPDPLALAFGMVLLSFNCVGVDSVAVDLGDEMDFAGIETQGQAATIAGGDGDDYLFGSPGDDTLDGGGGFDTLEGGAGSDTLKGGADSDTLDGDYTVIGIDGDEERSEEAPEGAPDVLDGGDGDDVLRGGMGSDVLAGGDGLDTADYGARSDRSTVTLDGIANDGRDGENDALGADLEAVITGTGDDSVTGNDAENVLTTGPGNDDIAALGGEDQVFADDGRDTIDVRDGAADTVDCGDGSGDRVTADAADLTEDAGCERVDKPGGRRAGADGRIKPAALRLRILEVVRGPRGFVRMRGRLVVPDATARGTCAGTAIRLRLRSGRSRQTIDVPMDSACRFAAAVPLRVERGARVTARATFAGTALLRGVMSKRVRAPRR